MTILGMAASGVSRAEEHEDSWNQWEIGPEIYYFRYKEPDINVKFDGPMYGLAASFTHHHSNHLMLTAEGRGAGGTVNYTGSGTIDGIPDWTAEGRIAAGYDISLNESRRLTPFLGVGYRYLNDDSSGKTSSTGARGYDRESNYLYSPIGLEFNTQLNEGWKLGVSAEYDFFWRGEQKSHLEDASPSFNTVSNNQNNGYGIRGGLKLEKKGERFDFLIGPYVRWWHIGNSKSANITFSGVIVGTGYEPKNEALEVGGQLAVRF
ncbi:MAG: autotransporter domain-containing protein [Candidatus Omnitrophica bacterium]|nr:autotransporter domain-containing protein [Candidatus Omnitrophota bacterium]